MISQSLKKQNPEKLKPSKIPTQTKNVGIGHRMKINDIIGFLSYIMNIFSINISDELIESLSPWPHSLKLGKLNNVEAITKRCRKSTNNSQRFSWALEYKITIVKTMIQSFQIWLRKIMLPARQRFSQLSNFNRFLRDQTVNKNKMKPSKEVPEQNTSNSKQFNNH